MMRKIAIAATTALGVTGLTLALADNAEAQRRPAKCVQVTGKGTGIGNQLARQFATDALVDEQAQRRWKGQGKITYKCSTTGVTTCTATQRACPIPPAKKKKG